MSDEVSGTKAFAKYGENFQFDESFLDDKSSLFGLNTSQLPDASSLEQLMLVLTVAT
ncbi:hypothetical protein [Deinococcus sp. QL22]|uniref:hypothetical protein n=1 Tax=Deinococcus sp. QL22 TaxID=2939437 RepID=UPI002018266F|nr:hypothetical protein [Deinococcus sp. QL22]UQN07234.1 hypothetical protein M1R55_04830 [Deinococcus sp. QL22]